MGKFAGLINSDVYGEQFEELKPVLLSYTAAEMEALDADGLLNNQETSTTEVKVATTFLAQPVVPRGLTFTPSASADAGNILVEGVSIADKVISESVATSTTNAVSSACAYKEVTKVTFPIDDGSITWDAGWDDRIGLPFILSAKPFALEMFNDAIQTTYGAFAVDADEVEKNTYDPNGTLDGEKTMKLLLFV